MTSVVLDPPRHLWAGSAALLREVDDPESSLWLERRRNAGQQRDWILHLGIHANHQYRIQSGRQLWVFVRTLHRLDVVEPLPADPVGDRLEHLSLDVLGIDSSVGTDPPR